jgi:DUF1009 family protein
MSSHVLGLVAGNGDLPRLVAEGARAQGRTVVTAALLGEADPKVRELSAVYEETRIGQLGAMIDTLRRGGASECVMVGSFSKQRLFSRVLPDLAALSIVAKLRRQLRDDAILRAIAELFESKGIKVLAVPPFIPDHMARAGVMTHRSPTPDEQDDMGYGMRVARATGLLDVGQTVVVRRGTVLAVEAVEGTDAAIKRGAALGKSGGAAGKGGVVVCKVVKPHQDLRLDLPAIGPQTVNTCANHGVRVLAVEAEHTIMVDRAKTIDAANERRMVLVGVPRNAGE